MVWELLIIAYKMLISKFENNSKKELNSPASTHETKMYLWFLFSPVLTSAFGKIITKIGKTSYFIFYLNSKKIWNKYISIKNIRITRVADPNLRTANFADRKK